MNIHTDLIFHLIFLWAKFVPSQLKMKIQIKGFTLAVSIIIIFILCAAVSAEDAQQTGPKISIKTHDTSKSSPKQDERSNKDQQNVENKEEKKNHDPIHSNIGKHQKKFRNLFDYLKEERKKIQQRLYDMGDIFEKEQKEKKENSWTNNMIKSFEDFFKRDRDFGHELTRTDIDKEIDQMERNFKEQEKFYDKIFSNLFNSSKKKTMRTSVDYDKENRLYHLKIRNIPHDFEKDNLKVSVRKESDQDILEISGEKKNQQSLNSFHQEYTFPKGSISEDQVRAKFEDRTLTLDVPKNQETKQDVRSIQID